jgi:hypothetical protein
LTFIGAPLFGIYAAIYIANGFVIGWTEAYRVNISIDAPTDTTAPALAWFLSVAGWLIVPVLTGAVAGYLVNSYIGRWRSGKIEDVIPGNKRG